MAQKPKKCISADHAKKMQKNFEKSVKNTLKKELGKEVSHDFWWSLEEIEEYIAYVKEEAKAKGYKDLGLRFSLGKYDDHEKDGDLSAYIQPTGVKTPTEEGVALRSAANDESEEVIIEDIDGYNDSLNGWPPEK